MRTSRQIWNIPLKGGMLERYHDGEGLEDAHKWCLIMGWGRSSVAMKQSIASMRSIIYQKADKKFIYLIITMHQQFWTMSRIKYPLLFTNAWLLFLPYMNIFGPSYIRYWITGISSVTWFGNQFCLPDFLFERRKLFSERDTFQITWSIYLQNNGIHLLPNYWFVMGKEKEVKVFSLVLIYTV